MCVCWCVCVCVYICVVQQSYDILLLILMVLLLVQAILTSATVVHCASYKSQLRMGAPECNDSMHTQSHYCEVRQVCLSSSNKRHFRMWKMMHLILFQV